MRYLRETSEDIEFFFLCLKCHNKLLLLKRTDVTFKLVIRSATAQNPDDKNKQLSPLWEICLGVADSPAE